MTNFFFSKSPLMNIHTTDHIYKIAVRKKCFWFFFYLENSPVQTLAASTTNVIEATLLVVAVGGGTGIGIGGAHQCWLRMVVPEVRQWRGPLLCKGFFHFWLWETVTHISDGQGVGNQECPSVCSRPVVSYSVVPMSLPEGISGEPWSLRLQ